MELRPPRRARPGGLPAARRVLQPGRPGRGRAGGRHREAGRGGQIEPQEPEEAEARQQEQEEKQAENDEIVDLDVKNIELFLAVNSVKVENMPYCETCIIKNLCNGGCLGSQYEETGDLFTPIPSVCRLEFAKISSLIKAFKKIGVYDEIKGIVGQEKKVNLDALEGLL